MNQEEMLVIVQDIAEKLPGKGVLLVIVEDGGQAPKVSFIGNVEPMQAAQCFEIAYKTILAKEDPPPPPPPYVVPVDPSLN